MQVKPPFLSQPISFIKTLFLTSCLPLFVGILCDGILCLTDFLNAPFPINKDPHEFENPRNLFLLFIKQAQEISYGAYSSFIGFITAMIIINLVNIIIQKIIYNNDHLLLKKENTSFTSDPSLKTPTFKRASSVLFRIFGYALAYVALYSIYSLIIGTTSQEANILKTLKLDNVDYLSQNMRLMEAQPRMLEEKIFYNDHQLTMLSNKKNYTTFPLGRVLGSLNADASSMVFSPDGTILYAGKINCFGITMVDISDWDNPSLIQDWCLLQKQVNQKTSLSLTPDGKTLFASNMDYFMRFDFASDPFRAYYPNAYGALPRGLDIKFETSIVLLPDAKKVLVSGYGLQIYDISEKTPKLTKFDLPQKDSNLTKMTLSLDGKSLFLLNETLHIYDITDLHHWKEVSSFESQNTPCSFIQSKDGKTLSLIGFQKGTPNKVIIERVDISDVTAPKLIKAFPLNIESFSSLFGFDQSPKETYLYFTIQEERNSLETRMIVFDMFTEKILDDAQNLISQAKSLLFASDENSLMAVYKDSISALQLYRRSPNDRIFTISKEIFSQIPTAPKSSNQIMKEFSSSNGKFLLNVVELDNSAGSNFTFTDVSNRSLPIEISSFSASSGSKSLVISNDGKRLSVSFKLKIVIYDISDLKSIQILGSYALAITDRILEAALTSDGKTCYAMISTKSGGPRLRAFDLSIPSSVQEIDSYVHYSFLTASSNMLILLSKDDKSLFVVDEGIHVFNVSARKINPPQIKSVIIDSHRFIAQSISLSPNGKLLAVKREDTRACDLLLFDVRSWSSMKQISSFALPKPKDIKKVPVRFSSDSQFVYVDSIHGGQPSFLVLNISKPTSPIFQSVIQAEAGPVDNFIVSDDGRTAYMASDSQNTIYVTNLETSNSVFLKTESFLLGEKSYTDVMVLRQNDHGDYVPVNDNYRFVKTSLFSTKILSSESSTESKFSLLPYWMTFQKETGTFMIEPKKQGDMKTYTLQTVFSTQLTRDSFKSIYNDPGQIQSLITSLIIIGYLDSDLYVTSNLGTFDNFYVTTPENEKIYKLLKQNYFETYTMFDVIPSLLILDDSDKQKIEIDTPSENLLKIEIVFMDERVQFLKRKYGPLEPSITENKTKFTIEGPVDDVNQALDNLVINSEFNDLNCEGKITVWDHLNPSMNKTFKNLSSYFEFNEAPWVNPNEGFDVQSQINSRAIYTGEYFSLIFFNNTFIDKYSDGLHFTWISDNKERSPAPSWLIFNDLILQGTPPEEFFHRTFHLILVVQNEFKRIEVPVTLEIRLSLKYMLKLLIKYSPYVLTILGLWVFANRTYNVLKKNTYRHHKDFHICIGQEITAKDIYPIRFLGLEGQESELIWKHLQKKKKGELNKENIDEEIKKAVDKLPKKLLNLYHNGSDLSQKLIHQLIMNNLALCEISKKQEKETKKIFEKEIQYQLMDLVNWDPHGSCQINETKLVEVLKKSLNEEQEEEGLEVGLINQRVIDVDLLKDVMIAEAMKCQSVRSRKISTHLIIKEEVATNRIKKFLKKNLYDLQTAQEGKNTVYGIAYEIKNHVLCFSGVAEEMFCGKTIVLQITDRRHKILKEVWIHGIKKKEEGKSAFLDVSALEAQDKSYDML